MQDGHVIMHGKKVIIFLFDGISRNSVEDIKLHYEKAIGKPLEVKKAKVSFSIGE